MKNLSLLIVAAVIAAVAITGCKGSRSNETSDIVEFQNSQLNDALRAHDMTAASELADSMALYVDDLTPDETVTVLMAFLELHNSAAEAGRHEDDLVTLRKYVDVYDIAVGANPNDMRAAFAHARRINPSLDFEQAARDFRRALAEYDAVQTYGQDTAIDAAPADSTSKKASTDSVDTSKNASIAVD